MSPSPSQSLAMSLETITELFDFVMFAGKKQLKSNKSNFIESGETTPNILF